VRCETGRLKDNPAKVNPERKAGPTITHEVKEGRMVPKSPKLDLEAEALEALAKARALPCGQERAEALNLAFQPL